MRRSEFGVQFWFGWSAPCNSAKRSYNFLWYLANHAFLDVLPRTNTENFQLLSPNEHCWFSYKLPQSMAPTLSKQLPTSKYNILPKSLAHPSQQPSEYQHHSPTSPPHQARSQDTVPSKAPRHVFAFYPAASSQISACASSYPSTFLPPAPSSMHRHPDRCMAIVASWIRGTRMSIGGRRSFGVGERRFWDSGA